MRREIHRTSEKYKARKRRNRLLSGILCAALMLGEFGMAAGAGQIQVTGMPETVTAAESEQITEENQAENPGAGSNAETELSQPEAESGQTEENAAKPSQPESNPDVSGGNAWKPEDTGSEESDMRTESDEKTDAAGEKIMPLEASDASDMENLLQEKAFLDMYQSVFGAAYSENNTQILYVAGTAPTESIFSKGTKENPYTSLSDAYAAGNGNLVVYLMGDYRIGDAAYSGYSEEEELKTGWVNGNKPMIVTAEDGVGLPMYTSWNLGGNTGFYDISIRLKYNAGQDEEIFCNGNTVVIGGEGQNNVHMVLEGANSYPVLFGGSRNTTVAQTNLVVNGGTYSRIYSGGSYGSVVTGEAKLTVNGSVDGNEQSCSVFINKTNSGLTAEYTDLDDIVGGGATDISGTVGSVGSADLKINSLHNNGQRANYRITANGGHVSVGDASLRVTNSKIYYLYRGYGQIAKNLSITMDDSDIYMLSLKQQYPGAGLAENAVLSVSCRNSTLDGFNGREANASGSTESAVEGISQKLEFQNCILRQFNLYGNYNGAGETDTCILDTCSFTTGGYFTGVSGSKTEELTFRNMQQKIIFCPSQAEATKKTKEGESLGVYQNDRTKTHAVNITLINSEAEDTLEKRSWSELTLDEGSIFSGQNLTLSKISGQGTLRLKDGCTGSFAAVGDSTRMAFGSWGEVQDKCTIVAQYPSENGAEFYQEAGSGLYFKAIPGKNVSFWYLSAREIQDDASKCVYVDQSALEEGDGSFDAPFKTLEKAYQALTPERNQIVLTSEYVLGLDEELPEAKNMGEADVLFTAKDSVNDFSQYARLLIETKTTKTARNINIHNNTVFQNIAMAPALPGTAVSAVRMYTNNHRLEIGEGCDGAGAVSFFGGKADGEAVESVDLKVHSGKWRTIGITEGTVGSEANLPEERVSEDFRKNVNENTIVSIDIKNATAALLTMDPNAKVYGSVLFEMEGGRTGNSQLSFKGTVYGNVSVAYSGSLGTSSYGDYFEGTYYGKVKYSTMDVEKFDFFYSVGLSGTYYQGAEVLIGKNTVFGERAGINLVGQNGITAYAPIEYKVERGASVGAVYAAGAAKASFRDEGCIRLMIPEAAYLTTAGSREDVRAYKEELHEKFHLILTGKEGSVSGTENLYGFETVTIENGAGVSVTSPLHARELMIGEGAKFTGRGAVTVGTAEKEDGLLQIAGGARVNLQQPISVYGNVQGAAEATSPGMLALNNELYTDDTGNTSGSYSLITGSVNGKIALFTKLSFSGEACQKLYLKEAQAADAFVTTNDDIQLKKEVKGEYQVCLFGNQRDYSVVYVDGENGNDNNGGLSASEAVKTLEQAYELVTNGGTIVVSGPLTVAEWPQNAVTTATITSCNYVSEKDSVDYRTTNQAKLTMPKNVVLKADTAFTCVTIDKLEQLNAAGYKVVFGVEEGALPEGVENFSSNRIGSVHGSNETYAYPTSITIHSGTFNVVNPWTNDQRAERGEREREVISVVMTGGTVEQLGIREYVRPVGKAHFLLTGGRVKRLGSVSLTDYASPDYEEEYDIRDDFVFDSFYTGRTSNTIGKVTVRLADVNAKLPMICYGNSENNLIKGKVELYLKNTTVEDVYGGFGQNNATNTGIDTGKAEIHLGEGARIENLYCGSLGKVENLKEVAVSMEDDSAGIGNLYANGYAGTLGAGNILVSAENGTQAAVQIDFLRGKINNLQVGTADASGRAYITKDAASKVGLLQVSGGSIAEIESGAEFAGDYQSKGTADNPAEFRLANAAIIRFAGSVSGVTKVVSSNPAGFKNGLTISSGSYVGEAENLFLVEGEESLQYDSEQGIWSIPDTEDNEERNTVYVSSNGDDEAVGSRGTPVRTLGKAYQRAAELHQQILENDAIEENKKEELLSGMGICVIDSVTIGTMTENSESENGEKLTHVTVYGEDRKAKIEFTDAEPEFAIPMDTDFENIMFDDQCTTQDPAIYAQGHAVTLRESVETSHKSASGGRYLSIYGGAKEKDVADTNLTVLGGCFRSVYGGGYNGKVSGDVQLHVGKNIKVGTDISDVYDEKYSVYGGGQRANAAVVGNVTVTVDGGSYWAVRGGGQVAPIEGNITVDFWSGKIHALYGGGLEAEATAKNTTVSIGRKEASKEAEKAYITGFFRGSGVRGGLAQDTGTVTVTIYDNAFVQEGAEFCAGGYAGNVGSTHLTVEGGEINTNIYGGGWGVSASNEFGQIVNDTAVIVNGGTIRGNVFAGGNNGLVNGTTVLKLQSGEIYGNLYGGGNAAGVKASSVTISLEPSAEMQGNIFGGSYNIEAKDKDIQSSSHVVFEKGIVKGNVFGGSDTAGSIGNTAEVVITGNTAVTGAVFGGGCQAPLTIPVHITVEKDSELEGNIYGGGQGIAEEAGLVTSAKNILRSGANMLLGLFGKKDTFVLDNLQDANVPQTNVTIQGTVKGNIYGGGQLATVGNEAESNKAKSVTNVLIQDGARVEGNVYGGGQGSEDRDFARIFGKTSVELQGGEITNEASNSGDGGCIFGGGEIAPVAGDTNVTVTGGNVTNVFGGNDRSGSIDGHTNVTIVAAGQTAEKANVQNVYGGGRDAAYSGAGTRVVIEDGVVENAFGGGYGQGAVCEYTSLTLRGGSVNTAFAGGNAATVSQTAVLTVNTGAAQAEVASADKARTELETASADEAGAESQGSTAAEDTVPDAKNVVQTVFAGNNQADMAIQPEIHLQSGKIGTFYGGGNQGGMTVKDGLYYGADTFGSKEITIGTVYGGCNQADVAGGVTLGLTDGTYGEVYGGNNVSGEAHQSHVILNGEDLQVTTVYGGGNQADIANASVTALAGNIKTLYGGGNAATATASVQVSVGQKKEDGIREGNAEIANLYCGNNQADMAVVPTANLQKGTVQCFHGGGNRGAMDSGNEEEPIALDYTFDSADMKITDLYGGGREADVKGSVILTLAGAQVTNVYGGCNESGKVDEAQVIVAGDNTHTVYGGGRGEQTVVESAQVRMQNGTLEGNLYGGSGYGRVQQAAVTVQEKNPLTDKILIKGSVYGGGYGESSVVGESSVTIDMALAISNQENDAADLIVTEAPAEEAGEEKPSGETSTRVTWQKQAVSCIQGSVYGGGDMGKVGSGRINQSANTAEIDETGITRVQVKGGYIQGSVFGGGSGTPAGNHSYTAYMGTVFGSCAVEMTGGYVAGSIYGCGHQSRVYAPQGEKAAVVNIREVSDSTDSNAAAKSAGSGGIIIGTSVFGGGNKGEGNNQNASVYTVIGDTEVNLTGIQDKQTSTGIYFLSDSKGGVYGDGNLCLVNGERVVNLTDFHYGSENKALLKTFYSLQRADEVNLTRSRVVLRGAKDLVDETADDTEYSINRVGQLNMKESSALKLTNVVNLLGGLSSDQNTETVYIDRGNNGENDYGNRGGEKPEAALKKEQIAEYQEAYLHFLDKGGKESKNYKSFNVVSVANGSYLEIKKSDTEYGNVTGLFTLELLHANPGEGGGFVYAEIGSEGMSGSGSTGDFICTTPNAEADEGGSVTYMDVRDTVGGYSNQGGAGDYTYYYWYIKGGRYTYKTQLKGYIGTTDTAFDTAVNLTELQKGYAYILNSVTGDVPVEEQNSSNRFCTARLVDHWKDEYKNQDKYAVEVRIVPGGSNEKLEEVSLGFLSFGDHLNSGQKCWGIKKDAGTANEKVITGTGSENVTDTATLQKNEVYQVLEGTTGLSLQFVLHKGTGVTVEFKDVPVTLTFDVFEKKDDGYETGNGKDNAHLTVNTYTSITRLVPTQAAYISSGRLYAGVSSDIPVNITKDSAFTAQFITKFVPSAFNTGSNQQIQEVLTTGFEELYLLDKESGIGFTAVEAENGTLEITYATEGHPKDYTLEKTADGGYEVTYIVKEEDTETEVTHSLEVANENRRPATIHLPEGTVITLVARIDDSDPTYWYYYCTEEKTEDIPLSQFRRMGTEGTFGADADGNGSGAQGNNFYSFANASNGTISPASSNRVTENLTFVFDFSNVSEETATEYPWMKDESVTGALRLQHLTTIGSISGVDIMDYVSTTSKINDDGTTETLYTREYPAVSNTFNVSKEKTGLKEFTVEIPQKDAYFTKDIYPVEITIVEDEEFVNTQYGEREYAVVLQQIATAADGTDQVIPFPEGTLFRYQGQNLIAGNRNQSVILPVKKAGEHRAELETTLEGFATGDVTLRATLYSSSVASYYNSLDTNQETTVPFMVTEKPEASVRITQEAQAQQTGPDTPKTAEQGAQSASREAESAGQIFAGGDTLTLTVECKPVGGFGTVGIFQYERGGDSYSRLSLTEVFETAADSFAASEQSSQWQAVIREDAPAGTYRLEFQYEDKTEYWDFVIR